MKMKLVLVDSDNDRRYVLGDLLMMHNIFEEPVHFQTVNEALDYICTHDVDAVFTYDEVGDARFSSDGSFLIAYLLQQKPDLLTVLYSASENYSADLAFSLGCTQFFSLPLDGVALLRVVNRLKYMYDLLQYKQQASQKSMMIKTKTGYQLVQLDEVLYIERINRKIKMVTVRGEEIALTGYTLDDLECLLERNGFYRCYQSFIVNLSKISGIRVSNETKRYTILLAGYAGEIILSRERYTQMLALLKDRYANLSL